MKAHLIQPPQSRVANETTTVNYFQILHKDITAKKKSEGSMEWLEGTLGSGLYQFCILFTIGGEQKSYWERKKGSF